MSTHAVQDDHEADENTLVSFAPASGEEVWRGKCSDPEDAIARARKAWPDWAGLALTTRIETMRRFANAVRKRHEEMATLIAKEVGKPMWEARDEVDAVIDKVEISITAYAERTGKKKFDSALQGSAAMRHKPHGVLAVLGPFNFPAHLPNGHIVPALIAGNTIVFKPSEKAPAVAELLVKCMREGELPENVVQIVFGGPETGKTLVAHPDIDGVLFTGSAPAGIAINRMLAANPGRIVALEMGGNNPLIVIDTPKLRDAAALIIQSAFTTAGQRCTSARRLIVKESVYDGLMETLIAMVRKLVIGEPFADPPPFMGPVIDMDAADSLTQQFIKLLSAGGQPLLHLRQLQDDRPFLSPGIIDITGMRERPDLEMFGPLLQVVKVPDLDSAITEANNTRYGLSAGLIGGTPEDYGRFWANIRAGIINWNRPTNGASSAAPFGGIGLSGNHRPSAYYAADYCAYPVASNEMDQPRANIAIGIEH